jgi:glutamyl-tRNA synthetase
MMLDAKELSRYVGFADVEIGELAKVYLEEANTTKELRSKVGAIFAPKEIPEELKESVAVIAAIIKKAPYFDRYEEFENYIMQESGIKGENLLKSLRLLLMGAEDSSDIAAVYKCIKNYIGEIVK